jgi:hypothetical protein
LGYYLWSFGDFALGFMGIRYLEGTVFPTGVLLSIFIIIVAVSVFYALLHGAVLGTLKSYANNNGEVLESEVKFEAKSKFWKLWGGNIVAGVLVGLGFIMCLVPGIYLLVPLSLITSVIVFQNKDIMDAFSECFQLIKDNWWITFATILILGILFYVINFIIQVPLAIYMIIKYSSTDGSSANPNEVVDWGFIALNLLFTLLQYLIGSILVIAMGFIYFNLNEKHHHTGTFEEIEGLGKE